MHLDAGGRLEAGHQVVPYRPQVLVWSEHRDIREGIALFDTAGVEHAGVPIDVGHEIPGASLVHEPVRVRGEPLPAGFSAPSVAQADATSLSLRSAGRVPFRS